MHWRNHSNWVIVSILIAISMSFGCATSSSSPYWQKTAYGTWGYSQAELEILPIASIRNILSSKSESEFQIIQVFIRARNLDGIAKVTRMPGQEEVLVTDAQDKEVRINYWSYASNENLLYEDLIKESYKGIRPAPGYPACPDHLEKNIIWELLKVEETIGVKLTESLAMWPAASVSGYYFGNPEAKYFGLGKITEDQLKDYAKRRHISEEEARKWLNPNLAET